MNQYKAERLLSWTYGIISILISLTIVCMAVPYKHWRSTLDVCPGGYLENTNCGCILFGMHTFQYFTGSHDSYCLYGIIAPLPILIYAIVMLLFHAYRVCISNIGQYEDKNTTVMEEIEGESIVVSSRVQISHKSDVIVHCWIPNSLISGICAIYSIAHSGIITAGVMKTCSQYRTYIVTDLKAAGNHASLIHFRLNCQSIFDYMDYLQKDAPNSRRGDSNINTGLALYLALFAAWFAAILWIVITVVTAYRAYKEKDVLTCCGK